MQQIQQQPFKPRANLSYEERVYRNNRPANRALCYGNYAKSILMRIALNQNSRILEFGCGPGTNILKLEASTPAHVLFVDKDPECIRQASDRYHRRNVTSSNVDTTPRLQSCSFQCIDFLCRNGPTITEQITERNFDTVLAFYSLQYIAAAPEIAKNFFQNCAALTVSRASVLGIFPNAQRLFAAQHCAQKLFSITGLEKEVAPRSGIAYTFQIEGQQAYREYTLCTTDLFAAARETFVPMVHCSVLEFIQASEKQHSALCSSLFRCIVNNKGTAMSLTQAERQLIDLYDIVIFTKIK